MAANLNSTGRGHAGIGTFELFVLLAVRQLNSRQPGATAGEIYDRLIECGLEGSLSSVWVTLYRLERKHMVDGAGEMRSSEARRGGRPRRQYKLAPAGAEALGRALHHMARLTGQVEWSRELQSWGHNEEETDKVADTALDWGGQWKN